MLQYEDNPNAFWQGYRRCTCQVQKGDDGSDRVLCVAPQFISGQEYIISATNEDGRDDDESLTPFNFSDTKFEGFTASKQEVVVEPVYNEQRKHFTVCFYERGEYHLKTKEDGALVIMNIKYEAAKHGIYIMGEN